MKFALTLLGVSGATPAHGRFPTSQYLQVHNSHFLIDCGEGSQMRMASFGVPRQKIEQIFISHLHGDHIFGLPGFLFSLALNDRTKPIEIFSPKGLKEMMTPLLPPHGGMPFPIIFTELKEENKVIFENDTVEVWSIPLKHRVPTCGFLFKEKESEKNIRKEKIKEYNLSIEQIVAIKGGEDLILGNGQVVENSDLTHSPWKSRSFAFVSDSIFDLELVPFLKGVDLLYHETTFCEDFKENAARTMHSTAKQAAEIAKKAEVGKLIMGHYSSRYIELDSFKKEAQSVFTNSVLGVEGETHEIIRTRERKNRA